MQPNLSANILNAIAQKDQRLFWEGVHQVIQSDGDQNQLRELASQCDDEGVVFLIEQLSLLDNHPQIEHQRINVSQDDVSPNRECQCCIEECDR